MKPLIALLCLYCLASCRQETSSLTEYLSQVYPNQPTSQYTVVVVLPQNSCSSCLSKVVAFLNRQQTVNQPVAVVLSGHSQPEILALKSALKNPAFSYLTDLKYQYLSYEVFKAGEPFWVQRNADGSTQAYSLEARLLEQNMTLLREALTGGQ